MSETNGAAPPMLTPFDLRGMTLINRVVMSPMCMYSSEDGTANDFHLVHLGSRAMGGAGLVFTEMTNVEPAGRISPGCAGMYKPEHVPAWKRVTDFVHNGTAAKIGVQLGHAGRKAATPEPWNDDSEANHWEIYAPSPIAFSDGSPTPKEMDRMDMNRVRDAFAAAAYMADEAGFDIIELHCGHGYLLSSFISPLTNKRVDDYGGSLENRMRFPLEVFQAARDAFPDNKPISARISAFDWVDGGTTEQDAVEISRLFKEAGLDILDVSTGNVVPGGRPTVTGLFQTPFSEKIRNEAGIPTMTVGNITGPAEINEIIAGGRADLCVVGKGHLYDPYFVRHAARALDVDGPELPRQYERAAGFTPSF
jgi:anthraniloyl-CoA monooxygenase